MWINCRTSIGVLTNTSCHCGKHFSGDAIKWRFTLRKADNLVNCKCADCLTHFDSTGGDVRSQDYIRQLPQLMILWQRLEGISNVQRHSYASRTELSK